MATVQKLGKSAWVDRVLISNEVLCLCLLLCFDLHRIVYIEYYSLHKEPIIYKNKEPIGFVYINRVSSLIN